MIKPYYNILALMSGTSLDGLDIISVEFSFCTHWSFKIHAVETIKYNSFWKSTLANLVTMDMDQLKEIDIKYSEYLAFEIVNFIDRHKIENIDFIASHGHTALHQPENKITYQIGNHQILANNLNRKVICDFRVQDVAFGGQGAPLVPIGDQLLFKTYDYCLNLGGFANISFAEQNQRVAFDICPVNIVLNHYVSTINLEYDDKGEIASSGKIDENLLLILNQLQFYSEQAPKSLGLEWVCQNIFPLIDGLKLELKDILRTFIEHIAIQISKILNKNNTKVIVTGGGVYNNFLMTRIKALSKSEISIPKNEIIEYKEALIFGLLGVLKDRNEVNCLKSVTGAKRDHSSGKILMPKNKI
ncbi:anhydro-N-acetylmuramic acid kinase [Winogradskyella eckloniae]|uniref:anhydro-N-acetylmuramic acid kinase n=1 Tax=Winogradskyella eckloniae TaxID=1089306 RepID=UPI0015648263|nr:anhydro-N-acetylmuramic acid kinase [Winogradskyella eckloniae]NRD20957.1 anhydro-N-acetylmuramic acid kinase [Winogradskyella eckloniae]